MQYATFDGNTLTTFEVIKQIFGFFLWTWCKWCPYHQIVKKIKDMCVWLNTIPQRERQTDRQIWYITIALYCATRLQTATFLPHLSVSPSVCPPQILDNYRRTRSCTWLDVVQDKNLFSHYPMLSNRVLIACQHKDTVILTVHERDTGEGVPSVCQSCCSTVCKWTYITNLFNHVLRTSF